MNGSRWLMRRGAGRTAGRRMPVRWWVRPGAGAILASLVACARSTAPPTPEETAAAPPPALTGSTVMVLPAQPGPAGGVATEPVPGLDTEIRFWLHERLPRVDWVFPDEIERILDRSPSIQIDLHALAVSAFHRARVRNIGDPLFGDLNQLGALTSARAALVPVAAAWVRSGEGTGRVEMSLALIDNRTGRVIWFGVVAGEPGPEGSRTVAATAAESLANLFSR